MQTLLNIVNTRREQYGNDKLKPLRVKGFVALLCLFIFIVGDFFPDQSLIKTAQAQPGCAVCPCVDSNHAATRAHISAQHQATHNHIQQEFVQHREEFIVRNFFGRHVLPAMMMMTEQLTTTSMYQMFIVGAFFDAELNLDTQRKMRELSAKAHKDYHPSFQMCTIGTMTKNIGASRRQAEFAAFALNQGMMDRQSLNLNMASAGGSGLDSLRRWFTFIQRFCDPYDDGRELTPLCTPAIHPAHHFDVNSDVDYGRTVDNPLTINANFSNNNLDADEAEIFGLGSNLYGSDVIDFKADALFYNSGGYKSPYRQEYMRVRGILAKRSVAQNSYANIVGMKSSGSPNTFRQRTRYMRFLLEQLGMTDATEISRFLGGRPSYHAQMELLTKKIYQRPEFYTNLYDKPANVDRTRAAMRAIGLMQSMDMFNSRLRSEMLLSVAAELGLMEEQERVQDVLFKRKEGIVRPQ